MKMNFVRDFRVGAANISAQSFFGLNNEFECYNKLIRNNAAIHSDIIFT